MKTILLAAAAAAMALVAGPVLAGDKGAKASKLVGPQQPIPYAQLDAYLKASAKERATHDWWTAPAVAATASADASATAAASGEAKPAKKTKTSAKR